MHNLYEEELVLIRDHLSVYYVIIGNGFFVVRFHFIKQYWPC
jgi:hypothetical protein